MTEYLISTGKIGGSCRLRTCDQLVEGQKLFISRNLRLITNYCFNKFYYLFLFLLIHYYSFLQSLKSFLVLKLRNCNEQGRISKKAILSLKPDLNNK